ncbi:MAG: patatin, partial [Symploca sp. SIO1C4]|nr:patatin [Symploca sp. SIO1C4]
APPDIHRYVAEQILEEKDHEGKLRYIRLQLPLKEPCLAMDDASPENLKELLKQTDAYMSKKQATLEKFLENW